MDIKYLVIVTYTNSPSLQGVRIPNKTVKIQVKFSIRAFSLADNNAQVLKQDPWESTEAQGEYYITRGRSQWETWIPKASPGGQASLPHFLVTLLFNNRSPPPPPPRLGGCREQGHWPSQPRVPGTPSQLMTHCRCSGNVYRLKWKPLWRRAALSSRLCCPHSWANITSSLNRI